MRRLFIGLARAGWLKAALIVGGLTVAGVAVATAQGPAPAAGVQKVRFGGDRLETRIVIDLDRAAAGRMVADGAQDQRIVIGLPNVSVSGDLQGAGQGLVKRWVIDEAAGGARLSLDLGARAEVRRRFLLPPGDGATAYRYVIDLKAIEAPATLPKAQLKPIPVKAAPLRLKRVIVIDAGHGGKDPGSLGATVFEKDVTLAAAKALKARLEKTGRFQVVMIRETDTFVPLEARVQVARRADADLFISLHADSGPDVATRGASVYTLSEKGAERFARVMDKDDWLMKASMPGRDRAVSQILLDLSQRATKNRSAAFAQMLLEKVGAETPLLRRSHRDAGFVVLLAPDVPAVLLEMGFITNVEDERLLSNPTSRDRVVDAVGDAIESYFAPQLRKS
ncbi:MULTISPECIES: N-acetylmuramoyl-L-alanine amidase family protein [unclassified Caulobacter]|uniref:N-acetylmuramoyl-L-alanine amidase family protein n=1 Tax=unclassified Caulobacter TaxID=2648921 RepID=UPI000D3AA323|nr:MULTISPECIES: N-acetylmuramoyl-L-alanine amidase [unclassified Caulobacter]PTS91560.1 N-acetylmuramoyl-L-alanine amidase [Caulobacter sp. HMWF009]PTT10020.1 N-acetylmuramoyl-L-alanine amidase [Caulobacter sp. HMWF025]